MPQPYTYRFLTIIMLLLFTSYSLSAQDINRCDHDEKMQIIFDENPNYEQEIIDGIKEFKKNRNSVQNRQVVATIPVHIIILHDPGLGVGSGNNLDLDRIESQIDVLNEDFTATNDDYDDLPGNLDGGNPDIEFCLASVDPDGIETDGVTRYPFTGNFDNNSVENSVKSETTWDRTTYLNIWVVPNIGALGWAYLPTTNSLPNAILDGVVVATGTFGGPGEATLVPYHLGRTTTHEVGHYLGLRHVWGNGGCGSDDGFSDTASQSEPNYGCPNHPTVSCGTDDYINNYMDYVNDNCMFSFSEEQSDYMQLILNTSRSSLIGADNFACGSGTSAVTLEVVDIEDATCHDGDDGVIEVQVEDGSPPFVFTIFPGGNQNEDGVFENLTPDDYTITVVDGNGSEATLDDIEVDHPNDISTNLIITNEVSCIGASDGEIFLTAGGGNGNFEYEIEGVGTFDDTDITGLAAGDYEVLVVDDEGCTTDVFFTLDPPDTLETVIDTIVGVSCFGGADGMVDISAVGGTDSLFTYMINPDTSMANVIDTIFGGLTQDTFAFVAEDANGCVDTSLIIIPQPDSLSVEVESFIQGTCAGDSTASLILTTTGGNTTFTYTYDDLTFETDTISGLYAGTFLVTAIDENNCTDTVSYLVTDPIPAEIAIVEQVNAECGGASLGSVSVTSSSQHEPTYTLDGMTNSTGVFEGLTEGEYLVTSVDSFGCAVELAFNITVSGGAEVEVSEILDVQCAGEANGQFTISATGGSDFSYSIDGVNFQDDSTFTDLSSGDYMVIVMDGTGCTTPQSVTVNEPDVLDISVENIMDNACANDNQGSASLIVTGGNGEITYMIDGQEMSESLTNLESGTYQVEALDQNGCSTTTSFEINEPTPLVVNVSESTDSACASDDGTITISASGGTGEVTYILEGLSNTTGIFENLSSNNYIITVMDANSCSTEESITVGQAADLLLMVDNVLDETCPAENNGSVSLSFEGGNGEIQFFIDGEPFTESELNDLTPGDYMISIMDSEGCSDQEMITINPAIAIESEILNSTNISCNGGNDGEIVVTASGGNGELTYTLGNVSNTDGVFTDLATTDHMIIISDSNNCSIEVPVSIAMPAPIVVTAMESTPTSCEGNTDGTLSIGADGGNGNYLYSLDGQVSETGTYENLAAGTYVIDITDVLGCSQSASIDVEDGAPLSVEVAQEIAASCLGGSDGMVELTVEGGSGDYTYAIDGTTYDNELIHGLEAGEYIVMVIDILGCSSQIEFVIEDGEELLFVASNGVTRCFGEASGSVQVEATSGQAPFTFMMNGESNSTGQFENLAAGEFDFAIIDANGCQASGIASVTETTEINVINTSSIAPTCVGDANGSIIVEANGGAGDYQMMINGNLYDSTTADGFGSGEYTVTIIDGNNCSIVTSAMVEEAEAIVLNEINNEQPTCFGSNTGEITVLATGGDGEFIYELGTSTSDDGTFGSLAADTYTITAIDGNGCTQTLEVTVADPSPVVLSTLDVIEPSCAGESDGSLTVVANGGAENYSYEIDGVISQTGTFDNLPAQDYLVTVLDDNGCPAVTTVTISEPAELVLQDLIPSRVSCHDDADGSIAYDAIGGTGTYEVVIENEQGQQIPSQDNLAVGLYALTIMDENGCIATSPFEIENVMPLDTASIQLEEINQDVLGTIVIEAEGGTEPYEYSIDNLSFQSIPEFTNLESGTYQVTIKDANDCEASFAVSISDFELCDGIIEGEIADLVISPNPANNIISFSFCSSSQQDVIYSFYDDRGRVIYGFDRSYDAGLLEERIDVSLFPQGLYILSVATQNRTSHYKFIKID